MSDTVPVAKLVRDHAEAVGPGGFVNAADVAGSRNGVAIELHRMARRGDLVHVHRGLYWVPDGRHPRPSSERVALEVGGPGSGPSGVSAARLLGLTSQLPSVHLMAVPRRVQGTVPGVRFRQRPASRRDLDLSAMEVAVVEVLRAGPTIVEGTTADIAEAVLRAAAEDRVRPAAVAAAVRQERDLGARRRWLECCEHADELLAGAA
jgi:predicted transcriptional regulator of viral defense system